jgi:ketosteroid isomerase-like protein
VTNSTDELTDRRSGEDRRQDVDPAAERPVTGSDPLAAWPLTIPDHLLEVRCPDPWMQVVHRSLLAERDGEHDEVSRAWDESVAWQLTAPDPTRADVDAGADGRGEAFRDAPHVGAERIIAYHRGLARLTDWTFSQELVSLESGRGPIVEAHLRTTASRAGRTLDTPTLLVFELSSLRVRRVTEIPGDLKAWEAFWRR